MMEPANDDGNCLPSHHEDAAAARGGDYFHRVVDDDDEYDDDDDDDDAGNEGGGVGRDSKEEDVSTLSLNELMYSAHSFHVISLPVSITMILAALAVTYVNTPETIQQGADMMSQAYHVWKVDADTDSTSRQIVLDFANGLVIVTVIGTMTFGIVLLYKYRCMKVLVGYMMFSSMTLLGVLGAELFNVAIEKYRIPIDWYTFVFAIYNFAVVGVTAIFYGSGIPTIVTQGYLICSSVIISWQLSHFDTMSTWTLLIMLGLYDLCAVLTPCGPLRALVNLMSDEDSPEMPGLLYEAEIPEGLKRPVMSGRRGTNGRGGGDGGGGGGGDDGGDSSGSGGSVSPPSSMTAEGYRRPNVRVDDDPERRDDDSDDIVVVVGGYDAPSSGDATGGGAPPPSSGDVEMSSAIAGSNRKKARGTDDDGTAELADDAVAAAGTKTKTTTDAIDGRQRSVNSTGVGVGGGLAMSSSSSAADRRPSADTTAAIPFAIAKLYRLPLTSAPPFGTEANAGGKSRDGRLRRRKLRTPPVAPSGHISTSPLLKSEGVPGSSEDDDSSSSLSEDGSNGGDAPPYVIPDCEYTAGEFRDWLNSSVGIIYVN